MPGRAAELPVGGRLETDVLLHLHGPADRVVLDGAEAVVVELAGGVAARAVEQARRPEQAADVVGAERGLVAPAHAGPPMVAAIAASDRPT